MRVAQPESSVGVQFPGNLARPSQSRKASERATHAQWHSLCVISRGRVSPRLAITAIKSRYPSRRGCDFLKCGRVAPQIGIKFIANQTYFFLSFREPSRAVTSRGATRPHLLTASERRTYVPVLCYQTKPAETGFRVHQQVAVRRGIVRNEWQRVPLATRLQFLAVAVCQEWSPCRTAW